MISEHDLYSAESSRSRLRRLYHLLTYHRLTIVVYGASFMFPPFWILGFLAVLAVLFAPFMIYVIDKERKPVWLVYFAIMVGFPIALTLGLVGLAQFPAFTWCFPLVMFYLYCVLLRWAVADWICDASPTGLAEVQTKDRQEKLEFP